MRKQICSFLKSSISTNNNFLIEKSNLYDGNFFDPSIEYPTLSDFEKKGIEERVSPLLEICNVDVDQIGEPFIFEEDAMRTFLTSPDPLLQDALRSYANAVVEGIYGKTVFLRGIIEFSNICTKDCYYCGIRKGNGDVHRYRMTPEEIVECAMECNDAKYGTLMLQSGEMNHETDVSLLCDIVKEIKKQTNGELCVALSVGELSYEQYMDLFNAGVTRYLLRMESSNPELYAQMHPVDHSWSKRNECLDIMKEIGYYVGTGVLVNVPNQRIGDLIQDQYYFVEKGSDMLGMGPYIIQDNTPMAEIWKQKNGDMTKEEEELYLLKLLNLCLNMLAISRIQNPFANISATTALQLLHPQARELGLKSGANVVMPILTPENYRKDYTLYKRKAIVDNKKMRDELFRTILEFGKELCLSGDWGNPKTKEESNLKGF